MAKKKIVARRTKNTNVPDFTGSDSWDGEKFSRAKDAAFE